MVDFQEALQRLKEGNRRFVKHLRSTEAMMSQLRRGELVKGQKPFAIVLGCSDSRVPAEIVFDQGLGDLFVIRVAGNIVAPSQVGSVEFAAEAFGTRLVVVMGHTFCGAIDATLEAIEKPERAALAQPALHREPRAARHRGAGAHGPGQGPAAPDPRGGARQRPRLGEPPAPRLGASSSAWCSRTALRVVGAEYSLESGEVVFFDVRGPHLAALVL